VLTANVPVQPGEVEFRAYPRLLRKIVLLSLLWLPLFVLLTWLSIGRMRVVSVATSPNDKLLAASLASSDGDGEVYFLQPATGERTTLTHGKRSTGQLVLSPDGQTLAITSSEVESQPRPGENGLARVGVILLWDTAQMRQRRVLRGHESPITGLAFAFDGRILFSADSGYVLKRWDTASGREEASHKSRLAFQRMALSPDARLLAIGNTSGTVALLDPFTWRLKFPPLTPGASPIASLAFAPDGRTLAIAAVFDRKVRLLDSNTGQPRGAFSFPEG
jgi:WD40 repeat protein